MQVEKLTAHIVQWLKQYALESKMDGFVIGVSGGVDSAVTSTLCAMTGLKTLCVEMPIHQSKEQVTRAQEHIAGLEKQFTGVTSAQVDLSELFEGFKTQLPEISNSDTLRLSLANTRARLRMTTLYYFAGIHKYLVAGTGNKVEDFGVGFYTKYGDGGVDLSPIADLLKSQVYTLAKHLKVSKDILEAAPTDGLFGDSRTDQDQIGASYDELEWAMKMQESGNTAGNFSPREEEVFKIYTRLNKANRHKMEPIPICKIPLEFI